MFCSLNESTWKTPTPTHPLKYTMRLEFGAAKLLPFLAKKKLSSKGRVPLRNCKRRGSKHELSPFLASRRKSINGYASVYHIWQTSTEMLNMDLTHFAAFSMWFGYNQYFTDPRLEHLKHQAKSRKARVKKKLFTNIVLIVNGWLQSSKLIMLSVSIQQDL